VIRFDQVGKKYPDGTVAVESLSLEAPSGQITVFVGPSGCGKTTSLRMINRMIEPTSGRIMLDDTDTAGLKRAGQKLIASGGEVVEDDDFVTVLQKAIRQVAADKTGPSGDECLHAGRV